MIAKPKYEWALSGNVDSVHNEISIEVDFEMLESIKRTLRNTITVMAESCRYDDLTEVLNAYLKLEKLSVIYYQMKEEQNREEEQNNDESLPEDETTGH